MSLRNRGISCHRGDFFQTGQGLGSTFKGLMNTISPIATRGFNYGKRFLKSDFVKDLSSKALRTGKDALTNIALDVLSGEKSLAESSREEMNDVKDKITKAINNIKERRGTKRKKTMNLHNVKIPKQFNLLED